MKRGTLVTFLAPIALISLSAALSAEVRDNPYQLIIERNPFGLKPPPPPPPAPIETNAPAAPPPDIKLTGITTLLGTPRVMLQVEDKQTKKPSFPMLAEGESDMSGAVTVLAIDPDNLKVRIKNGDAETTLDFKTHGVKPGAGAVAAGGPTPTPQPGAIPPPPAFNNLQGNNNRALIGGGAVAAPVAPAGFNPAVNSAGIPPRQMRTDNLSLIGGGQGGNIYNPNPTPQPTAQAPMSPQDAEAMIEARRRILEQQQNPMSRIMPPTSLGRQAGGAQPTPPPGPAPGQ
jgi:hypothetical protein